VSGLPVVNGAWVVAVGAFMVAPVRTFSPKSLRIPREWAAFVAIGVAILVGAMFTRFWLVMVVLDLGYIGLLAAGGWAAWKRRQTRRNNRGNDGH
jgi:CDP-diacylglycerol--serine O-phosphatidyltransferase